MTPRHTIAAAVAAFALSALVAGCQRAEIESYDVPKPTAPVAAPTGGGEAIRMVAAMFPTRDTVWYFRLTGPELSYILNDAGAHTIVADEHHRPVIDGIRDELPCRRYVSADAAADGWASLASVAAHSAPITGHEPVDPDEPVLVRRVDDATADRHVGRQGAH